MKTVSVIIPTYNYGEYLPDAIESVLSQSYPHIELIVVDDGSTDNTKELLEQYSVKVECIHQEHQGATIAKNNGVKQSSGKFFLILDADDKLHPKYVELTLNEILKDDEIGFVFTGCKCFGELDEIRIPRKPHHRFSILRTSGQLGASLIRRKAFDEAKGFDEKLPAFEDWDLCIRMCLKGWKCKAIFEPIHLRRVHGNGRNPKEKSRAIYCRRFIERKYWFMRLYVLFSRLFDSIVRFMREPVKATFLLKKKMLGEGWKRGLLWFLS